MTRYEVFCRDHHIPLFPPSDAILALYYGSSAKKLQSSEPTRRTKATQLRSLLYVCSDLYSNKSWRKLQQYPGSAAAMEEYIKKGSNNSRVHSLAILLAGEADISSLTSGVEPVSQSASAQPSGSSLPVQPGPSVCLNLFSSFIGLALISLNFAGLTPNWDVECDGQFDYASSLHLSYSCYRLRWLYCTSLPPLPRTSSSLLLWSDHARQPQIAVAIRWNSRTLCRGARSPYVLPRSRPHRRRTRYETSTQERGRGEFGTKSVSKRFST